MQLRLGKGFECPHFHLLFQVGRSALRSMRFHVDRALKNKTDIRFFSQWNAKWSIIGTINLVFNLLSGSSAAEVAFTL